MPLAGLPAPGGPLVFPPDDYSAVHLLDGLRDDRPDDCSAAHLVSGGQPDDCRAAPYWAASPDGQPGDLPVGLSAAQNSVDPPAGPQDDSLAALCSVALQAGRWDGQSGDSQADWCWAA